MVRSGPTRAVGALAVLAMAGACSLLEGSGLDEPTLTSAAADQAATNLATALDDLGARFLVDDPSTERLQVLHWEDDPDAAVDRLAEQLALDASAAAFVRASACEISRRAESSRAVTVETRVTETELLGSDEGGVDWVRVEIAQDETHDDGAVTSTATSYGLGVREGSVVEVRDLDSALPAAQPASAAAVVRSFAAAVLKGEEATVDKHLDSEQVSDRDIAALRAWLAAADSFEVVELPAAGEGSVRVAYVVPERGPLVRFDVLGGTARSSTAQLVWELEER